MKILEVRNLTKDFGGLRAVDALSLTIEKGQILGLIGPNGAGKSTAFNCIAGVFPPTRGDVLSPGKGSTGKSPGTCAKKGWPGPSRSSSPLPRKTVLLQRHGGQLSPPRTAGARPRKRPLGVLESLQLRRQKGHAGAGNLTIADRKRLEIARALATQPKLLLLDEVMAGLRPAEVDEMVGIIRELRDGGITIFVIEHIMRAIMALSDRIVVIHFGKKIAEGTPREVARTRT